MVQVSRKKPKRSAIRIEVVLCVIGVVVLTVVLTYESMSLMKAGTEGSGQVSVGSIVSQSGRRMGEGRRNVRKKLNKEPPRDSKPKKKKKKLPRDKEGTVTGAKKGGESDPPKYYVVFSTACDFKQNWQSYFFFYHAMEVGQPGDVVRIASGCTDEQASALKQFHEEKIRIMSDSFQLHLTPDFSGPDHYKYQNKPFGLRHWMQNSLGYPHKKDELDDAYIMLLDPDMILLRPLTHDFTGTNAIFHQDKDGTPIKTKVGHGTPLASVYGFGDQPFSHLERNMTYVTNSATSPALDVSQNDKMHHYPAGPPYIATGRDMYDIAITWCDFVPRVHEVYTGLLGEMFSYSLAAAHLGLPHQLMESFMVSGVDAPQEGWPLIDPTPVEDICEPFEPETLPSVLHFCQNYWIGKWFSGKYRLNKNWLSCEEPLLMVPPKDVGTQFDYYIRPGGSPYGEKEKMNPQQIKREAFMVCQMITRINAAGRWFKDHHCEKGTANYDETHVFHNHMDPDNIEGGEKDVAWR